MHSCWWVLIVGILTTFGGFALFDLWCFFQHNIDHRNFIFVVNFIRLCFISMLLLFPLSNIISNSNWVERTEKSATSIFFVELFITYFLYNRFCLSFSAANDPLKIHKSGFAPTKWTKICIKASLIVSRSRTCFSDALWKKVSFVLMKTKIRFVPIV